MSGKSTYNEDTALELCDRIAEGEALQNLCREPRFPDERTIRRWLAAQSIFRRAYARAREHQMERWADEIVTIADDASGDYVEQANNDGELERVFDPEAVQRARLRIDTRKFLMSKLAPRVYGDKLDLNLSGAVEVSSLSDAELEARTRARLVELGVEVGGPLLLPLPGQSPDPASDPEPLVIDAAPVEPAPPAEPASTAPAKRSAATLLGLD